MWNAVADRLKEPSTYAGVAVLAGLFGVHVTPEAYQGVLAVASSVAGIVAIFMPEKA